MNQTTVKQKALHGVFQTIQALYYKLYAFLECISFLLTLTSALSLMVFFDKHLSFTQFLYSIFANFICKIRCRIRGTSVA